VIATTAPGVLTVAQPVLAPKPPQLPTAVEAMHKAAAAAGIPKEIRGLIRAGVIRRFVSRQVLSGLTTPLAEDVLLLDLNAAPDLALPVVLTGTGLVLAILAGTLARRRPHRDEFVRDASDRATVLERLAPYIDRPSSPAGEFSDFPSTTMPQAPDDASAGPGSGASAHVVEAPVRDSTASSNAARLPRLMLLNLDRAAGPEAIEDAPPLGMKPDVIAHLHEVLPDLDIDQTGHGHHEGPDHVLDVDIGAQNTVHTLIVEARGETGVSAVRWLLEATGWRAFVPKVGRFVEPEALHEIVVVPAGEARGPS
jgi:hypothetical protein